MLLTIILLVCCLSLLILSIAVQRLFMILILRVLSRIPLLVLISAILRMLNLIFHPFTVSFLNLVMPLVLEIAVSSFRTLPIALIARLMDVGVAIVVLLVGVAATTTRSTRLINISCLIISIIVFEFVIRVKLTRSSVLLESWTLRIRSLH